MCCRWKCTDTIHYDVCQLAESEARAVTGRVKQTAAKIALHLNELTDGEMRIFRGIAFQICGLTYVWMMFSASCPVVSGCLCHAVQSVAIMCYYHWSHCVCRRPQGGGRALRLGGKKDVESFVDQLKSEGERMMMHSFYTLISCLSVIVYTQTDVCEELRDGNQWPAIYSSTPEDELLYSLIDLIVAWWCNGYSIRLAIKRLQVRLPAIPPSGNDSGQVVHTHVPLSPSSIIWYRSKWEGNGSMWERCGLPPT